MVKQYKVDEVSSLVSKLKDAGNIILTNFSGVKVKELSTLRNKLREKNCEYKIVKNNLFKRALQESGAVALDDYLKGPIGVVFIREDLTEAAKVLKEFNKEQEKFSFSIGVMENVIYTDDQIKKIADLPTKDVLLAQALSLINGPSAKIAIGINQVMASLARGIKAAAEKNAQ